MAKADKYINEWVQAHQSAHRKAGSLLITFFSDFVVTHGGRIGLGSLVEAGAKLGVSEQAVRSSVNRLVGEGWLHTEAQGRRSICSFSEQGARRCALVARRILQNPADEWHGEWHTLVTNVSSCADELSDSHVRDIMWSGFGRISANVFIRPKMVHKGQCCNLRFLNHMPGGIVCFSGELEECVSGKSIEELINKTWDLDTVRSRYAGFIDRYKQLSDAVLSVGVPDEVAFAIRSMVFHDFRRVRLIDPVLPAKLVPAKWNGDEAFRIVRDLYEYLIPGSERFIVENMQGPSGKMPRAKPGIYERFGGLAKV